MRARRLGQPAGWLGRSAKQTRAPVPHTAATPRAWAGPTLWEEAPSRPPAAVLAAPIQKSEAVALSRRRPASRSVTVQFIAAAVSYPRPSSTVESVCFSAPPLRPFVRCRCANTWQTVDVCSAKSSNSVLPKLEASLALMVSASL